MHNSHRKKVLSWTFIKKRLQHRCFLVDMEKFLRTTFWKNICERLLLKVPFMWKRKFSFLLHEIQSRVRKNYLSQFPIVEVANNFLVFWNYGFQNSICSSKESFISRRSKAVIQRCSVKNVFLEISQNWQENTCAKVSFLIKFLRTPFSTDHLWWLLLEDPLPLRFFNDESSRRKN